MKYAHIIIGMSIGMLISMAMFGTPPHTVIDFISGGVAALALHRFNAWVFEPSADRGLTEGK